MKRVLIVLTLLLCASLAQAQEEGEGGGWWMFENRRYYPALIAGVREPHLSALALGFGDKIEFQVSDESPRRIWDIDVGAEIPLFGWETTDMRRIGKGKKGFGLWIPIDFHVLEDFADASAPIVNTDYRFGGMVKFQYGLSDHSSVAARLHVGHESTHVGDEFVILAQREFRREFERVNVSWEYLDLGILYSSTPGHEWNVRLGITSTLPFGDTYYQVEQAQLTQSPLPVTPSKNSWDLYGGLEAVWTDAFKWKTKGFDVYGSAELRWRSVYDYHKESADTPEDRQASVNVIVGVKHNGDDLFGFASPFVRYYYGVNPHGQFRNQRDYTEYGIGLRLVR